MPIDILPDVKIKAVKIYPLGFADRQIVDKNFDKLHAQRRMEFTTQPTLYGYPVFVVWRTIRKERKKRVVINIRCLNKITVTNSYFMPLQTDITSAVAGCQFISVFDASSFFHQCLVRVTDRHKLTVVSHRGQKQFNVTVMGFKNFPLYVQKKIDVILRVYQQFIRVYVNDIIVFSYKLDEHISHLHAVFQLFDTYGSTLSFKKKKLNYPTVVLLGQKVDTFGFIIAADKLDAISKLDFLYAQRFKNVFKVNGMVTWFRALVYSKS